MKNFQSAFRALLVVAVTLTAVGLAQAQATRTWVSGVGDDVNPCSRTAPCKTLAGSISKTAAGGEIDALDSGGFGSVTITKSITIDGTPMLAGILSSGTNGIIINIDPKDPAKSVRLRGLAINGAGTGKTGIDIIAADKVSVEDCVIDGCVNGIMVEGATSVFIRNSAIRNNSVAGINVSSEKGLVAASDLSLVFNAAPTIGPAASFVWYAGVVGFGNTTGDPARTAPPKKPN